MANVFNKKLSRVCEYCKYAVASEFGDDMLCLKKGVTKRDCSCRHYEYDVLKRKPKRIKPADNYNMEDFKLS